MKMKKQIAIILTFIMIASIVPMLSFGATSPTVWGVKASNAGYGSVKVSWSKNKTAKGYILYRSYAGGKYRAVKSFTKNTTISYTNRGLVNGKKYTFKVRAYKIYKGKKKYGSFSKGASAIPSFNRPTIKAHTYTSTSAKITWTRTPYATGYQVFKATNRDGSSFSQIALIKNNSTSSFIDKGSFAYSDGYCYVVRAYQIIGSSVKYSSISNYGYASPNSTWQLFTEIPNKNNLAMKDLVVKIYNSSAKTMYAMQTKGVNDAFYLNDAYDDNAIANDIMLYRASNKKEIGSSLTSSAISPGTTVTLTYRLTGVAQKYIQEDSGAVIPLMYNGSRIWVFVASDGWSDVTSTMKTLAQSSLSIKNIKNIDKEIKFEGLNNVMIQDIAL